MKQNAGKMRNHINRIRQKTRIPKLRYVFFFVSCPRGGAGGVFTKLLINIPNIITEFCGKISNFTPKFIYKKGI